MEDTKMKYIFPLMSVLLWAGLACCQDSGSAKPNADATQRPTCVPEAKATTETSGNAKMAKIVVYREGKFVGKIIKPPVICDGLDVAFMPNGGYITLLASPGTHSVESDSPHSPVTVDVKEGEVSYVKLHIVIGATHGLGAVEQVTPDEGQKDTAKLKPVTDAKWFEIEKKAH
jgi:hypothetical protein